MVFHWFFKGNLALLLLTFMTLLSAQTNVNNIMPVGRICGAGQACVGVPAGAMNDPITEEVRSDTIADASVLSGAADQPENSADANPTSSSTGETYEVQMRNQGIDGVMVFEPSVLHIEVGDSVTFKATDAGHNSASIEGFVKLLFSKVTPSKYNSSFQSLPHAGLVKPILSCVSLETHPIL